MSNFMHDTWFKIFELGQSEEEMEQAYAKILTTLVRIRLDKGMTQSELSKKSGLTTSMISKIEAQHSVPSLKSFLKYLQGLNMDWEIKSR